MELKLKSITKKYGNKTAIDKLSLQLKPGIYGLLGPNGAGKSTLINMLVGNLSPNTGEILLNGSNIQTLKEKYRDRIGYMPQQQGLYDYFSGYRFLSYMAALKGMPEEKAKEEIAYFTEKVNLSDVVSNKIGSYSGGMKQRLLLAQALLNSPDIVILDEPTAGLDPKERIRVRNLIAEFAIDQIVLIATHVVQDIEYIANEIIILKQGKVLRVGKPEEILEDIRDKTYEIFIEKNRVDHYIQEYCVSNLIAQEQNVKVKIISDSPPGEEYSIVQPNLEDYYLYMFQEERIY